MTTLLELTNYSAKQSDQPSPSFRDPLNGEHWSVWLAALLPTYCTARFATHHGEFWDWVWAIEPGNRPSAFVAIWPRGGAKSTSAESACVALGARRARRYGLYVSDTQDRADDHVANIGAMLESQRVEVFYPELASRMVGKFGNSKGWRRNRLRTSSGFTVDAIGLDTAARGIKLEDQRPDFLVIDDIDSPHDTPDITRKKTVTLTQSLIPAGANDLAILAIQNLVHPNGVFARLVDDRADFLKRRSVSGPIPALRDFNVVDGLAQGDATWEGQDLERCRQMIDDMGIKAFRRECQHEVSEVEGALWTIDLIEENRVSEAPQLARVVIAVDPAVTSNDDSDETGLVVVGRGVDGNGYVLDDLSGRYSPDAWARRCLDALDMRQGDRIVAEVNNGGDLVEHTIRTVRTGAPYSAVRASRGKVARAEPISALYEQHKIHHVGYFAKLEEQMTTWTQGDKSPDRLDALVWGLTELFPNSGGPAQLLGVM